MKNQLAKCEPVEGCIVHRPAIREVKFEEPKPKAALFGRALKCLGGFAEWILGFAAADDDIETWRRLEFRNEYEARREPKMLDIHRWY